MAHESTPANKPSNFLRGIIERDLEAGTWSQRRWGGSPGDGAHHGAVTLLKLGGQGLRQRLVDAEVQRLRSQR